MTVNSPSYCGRIRRDIAGELGVILRVSHVSYVGVANDWGCGLKIFVKWLLCGAGKDSLRKC